MQISVIGGGGGDGGSSGNAGISFPFVVVAAVAVIESLQLSKHTHALLGHMMVRGNKFSKYFGAQMKILTSVTVTVSCLLACLLVYLRT